MPEMVSIGRHHHHHGGAVNKLTKARGKMVKPILKKLAPSPKNSLDLDRGWDEQQIEQMENSDWSGHGGGVAAIGASSRASSVRDMNFGFSGGYEGNLVTAGGGSGSSIRSKFHHGRSASQASTGSGPSRGAFVHPFAQAPRTATPPLSYANSLASFDNTTNYTGGRDCSPTITEDEDDEDKFDTDYSSAQGKTPHHSTSNAPPAALSSQSNLRRPSLQSQRTSSYTEVPSKPPSLRINTAGSTPRSVSGATVVSRLAHGSSVSTASQSDLHLTSSVSVPVGGAVDSPTGSLGAGTINNSSSGATQMSPLRSSLDMAGFPRLRSRSELDTASRAENIRAARRKFEEREKIKEEKYDREMIKKRERKDNKEASRIEKGETVRPSVQRKNTAGSISTLSSPKLHGPTVFSRKGASWAPESTNNSRNDLVASGYESSSAPPMGMIGRRHTDSPSAEKHMGFASRKYDSVPLQTPPAFGPNVDDVRFEQTRPRRGSNTRRKTQSYWAGFMLWLRTKLLRVGR